MKNSQTPPQMHINSPRFIAALLVLAATFACGLPGRPTSTPGETPLPTPTLTEAPPSTMPPPTTEPTIPPPTPLATVISLPAVAPQPLADQSEIVVAVADSSSAAVPSASDIWAGLRLRGSFTTPDARQQVALVGNIGSSDEMRWVVVDQTGGSERVAGYSEPLGYGFSAPPPAYLSPEAIDFDDDGRDELLIHYARMQLGWITGFDAIYRWDGEQFAQIWSLTTVLDNTTADAQDVPQGFKIAQSAVWSWREPSGDSPPEIVVEHTATFYPADTSGDDAADTALASDSARQVFHWDGAQFQPHAREDGPAGSFAYVTDGEAQLWTAGMPHGLHVAGPSILEWSPDALELAWVAPARLDNCSGTTIGTLTLPEGPQRTYCLDQMPANCCWYPDNRVACAFTDQRSVLIDPATGGQTVLPFAALGAVSPDAAQVAVASGSTLVLHRFATAADWPLVAPETAYLNPPAISRPVWSPDGDHIAFLLTAADGDVSAGLVPSTGSKPIALETLHTAFKGFAASHVDLRWSPDGSALAALASAPSNAGIGPVRLYLVSVGPDVVASSDWHEVSEIRASSVAASRIDWAPDSDVLTVGSGSQIWNIAPDGSVALRHQFAAPNPIWNVLDWAPDGSGFLAGFDYGYGTILYWFPAAAISDSGIEPAILLTKPFSALSWSPIPLELDRTITVGQAELRHIRIELPR